MPLKAALNFARWAKFAPFALRKIFALLTSLLDASYYLCNQTVKLSPQLFILLRGYIPALLVFPFLPFFQAPEKPIFYLVCVGQGIFIAYHDFAGFKAIRRFGAEIVSSILPLSTGMLFVFWLVAEPSMSVQYWMNKTQFLLITASVTGIIY